MKTERARVLYMPNERGTGRQRGPRLALAQLEAAGAISEGRVFSYLRRLEADSRAETFNRLCSTIETFKPTLVLLQHPADTGLLGAQWQKLRSIHPFKLVYHEGDAYDRFRKRIPAEMKAAAATADVSFSTGASRQLEYMRSAGSRDARWTPQVYNAMDFGSATIPSHREYDVVMIANESSSKIPFKSIPGSKDRTRLVESLTRRFGTRFAVYGRGWTGPSAKGPLDFVEQEQAIQSAWISANWDHYPSEKRWFSDRLPISLAAGSIHVTSSHPGYEDIFDRELGFLHFEKSVIDVVQRIETTLDSSDEDRLLTLMRKGRSYADDNFRQDNNFVDLLNAGGAGIQLEDEQNVWLADIAATNEY